MVWDLTPSAGEWLANARRTETAWAAHLTERYKLLGPLSDLMALGLVTVMRDIHGHLWGAAPTGAVPEWPDAPATGADPDAAHAIFCGQYGVLADRADLAETLPEASEAVRGAGCAGQQLPGY